MHTLAEGVVIEGRGWRWRDQARRGAALCGALALLSGCAIPRDIDPRLIVANLFGAHLEGREPPPGLDRPYPTLGSVPARPVAPDPAERARLSAALAADREQSREPLPRTTAAARILAEQPPAPPNLRLPAQAALPALVAPPVTTAPPLDLQPPPLPTPDLLAPRRN